MNKSNRMTDATHPGREGETVSGGSWDYVYQRFEDVAVRLMSSESYDRRALGVLIKRVSKAMHEIEWEDSGDGGRETEAIRVALGTERPALIRDELRRDLDRIIDEATRLRSES